MIKLIAIVTILLLQSFAAAQAARVFDFPIFWEGAQKNAVHFDGTKELGLGRVFQMDIYNVPDYTDHMAAHYWYRSSSPTPNGNVEAFIFNADTDLNKAPHSLPVYISHTADQNGNVYLTIGVWVEWCCFTDGTIGYNSLNWISDDPLPYALFDKRFHPVGVSISQIGQYDNQRHVTLAKAQYALDDNSVHDLTLYEGVALIGSQVAPNPSVRGLPLHVVSGWQVGGDLGTEEAIGGGFFKGDVAELYIDFNHREDLGASWLGSFRTDSGRAVGLGPNCTKPTGSVPNLCLRGDPIWFVRGPPIDTRSPPTLAYRFDVLPGGEHLDPVLDTDPCFVSGQIPALLIKRGCSPN